jgi:hypothetical protein
MYYLGLDTGWAQHKHKSLHTSSFRLLTKRTQPAEPMVPAKRIPAALRAVVAAAPGIWKPASGIPAAAIQYQALTINS